MHGAPLRPCHGKLDRWYDLCRTLLYLGIARIKWQRKQQLAYTPKGEQTYQHKEKRGIIRILWLLIFYEFSVLTFWPVGPEQALDARGGLYCSDCARVLRNKIIKTLDSNICNYKANQHPNWISNFLRSEQKSFIITYTSPNLLEFQPCVARHKSYRAVLLVWRALRASGCVSSAVCDYGVAYWDRPKLLALAHVASMLTIRENRTENVYHHNINLSFPSARNTTWVPVGVLKKEPWTDCPKSQSWYY